MISTWVAPIVSFLVALILTWCVRRVALAHDILDRPNTRSSHSVPTPRGGGTAIVVATMLGVVGLHLAHRLEWNLILAIIGGGLPVALIGFIDDRRSVPAKARFSVHVIAAAWAVYFLGGVSVLQVGNRLVDMGVAGSIVGTVAIIWSLNLFNFMDGIDGIASSEAAFVCFAGVLLSSTDTATGSAVVAMTVGAATLGFLAWNWPPAKIFMGDVGSGFLGYVIAVLALTFARENPVAIYVWLILGGVFFIDASVTLIRRLIRGERVYEAHRSHAYQWLSRRWGSHRTVTVAVLAINCVWLLPMAWLCQLNPKYALSIAVIALFPVVILTLLSGAGRPETGK